MYDAMLGDRTLFTDSEGIERLWAASADLLRGSAAAAPLRAGELRPAEDARADRAPALVAAGDLGLPAERVAECSRVRDDPSMPDRELGAGAWSYFGDPRAISHDGHTFTGWISTIGHVWVARYTRGGRLSQAADLPRPGPRRPQQPVAGLPPRRAPGGVLLAALRAPPAAARASRAVMRYRISLHPWSISELGPVHTVATNVPGGLGYTYPNPVQLRDKLWLFWRGGDWNPTFSYTEDGIHWVPARELVRFGHEPAPVREVRRRCRPPHPHDLYRRAPEQLEEQPALPALRGRRPLRRGRAQARQPQGRAAAYLRAGSHLPRTPTAAAAPGGTTSP